MSELDVWNDPFKRLHQIFVGALDCLSGRKRSSGVKNDDVAEPIPGSELRQALFHAVGYIQDLLVSASRDRNGDRGHGRSIGGRPGCVNSGPFDARCCDLAIRWPEPCRKP